MLENTQKYHLVTHMLLFGIGIIFSCNVFAAKPSVTYATKIELGDEASIREVADSALSGRIDSEVIDRTTSDDTLQANINSEVATREAADNTLQVNISTEETSRISGDLTLQHQMNLHSTSIVEGAEAICQLFTLHPEIQPPAFCDTTPPVVDHIVFVSQTQTTGFINVVEPGISSAFFICQNEADNAGVPGVFYPWINVSGSRIYDYFNPSVMDDSVSFILPSGNLVAENWTELTTGVLQHNIDEYVTGLPVIPTVMWTNAWENGDIYSEVLSYNCRDFTSELNSDQALVGSSEHSTEEWSRYVMQSCDQLANLICVQQTTTD